MSLYGEKFWAAERDAALVMTRTINGKGDELALPVDGALRGDVPLAETEQSEVQNG